VIRYVEGSTYCRLVRCSMRNPCASVPVSFGCDTYGLVENVVVPFVRVSWRGQDSAVMACLT
jgi:hypothetical protein